MAAPAAATSAQAFGTVGRKTSAAAGESLSVPAASGVFATLAPLASPTATPCLSAWFNQGPEAAHDEVEGFPVQRGERPHENRICGPQDAIAANTPEWSVRAALLAQPSHPMPLNDAAILHFPPVALSSPLEHWQLASGSRRPWHNAPVERFRRIKGYDWNESIQLRNCSITAMSHFEDCSFEEIRLADCTFGLEPPAEWEQATCEEVPEPFHKPSLLGLASVARTLADSVVLADHTDGGSAQEESAAAAVAENKEQQGLHAAHELRAPQEAAYRVASAESFFQPLNESHCSEWQREREFWDEPLHPVCVFPGQWSGLRRQLMCDAIASAGLLPDLASIVCAYVEPPGSFKLDVLRATPSPLHSLPAGAAVVAVSGELFSSALDPILRVSWCAKTAHPCASDAAGGVSAEAELQVLWTDEVRMWPASRQPPAVSPAAAGSVETGTASVAASEDAALRGASAVRQSCAALGSTRPAAAPAPPLCLRELRALPYDPEFEVFKYGVCYATTSQKPGTASVTHLKVEIASPDVTMCDLTLFFAHARL